MYAARSFDTGQVTGISEINSFGHWSTWVAFTASLLAPMVPASPMPVAPSGPWPARMSPNSRLAQHAVPDPHVEQVDRRIVHM
jgi:hypothetical protein